MNSFVRNHTLITFSFLIKLIDQGATITTLQDFIDIDIEYL